MMVLPLAIALSILLRHVGTVLEESSNSKAEMRRASSMGSCWLRLPLRRADSMPASATAATAESLVAL